MATAITVNADYNGAAAGEVFVEAFKKSDTIEKGVITVLPNNIGSGSLPRISYTADLQDYVCGWDPAGDVDFDDVTVALKKFKVQHELCKNDFRNTFQAQAQGLFAANSDIPQDIESGILLAVVNNLGANVDKFIWDGSGTYVGLKGQILADTSVIGFYEGALTKANVVTALGAAYELIPEEIIDEPDVVIVGSPKLTRLYKQNLAEQGLRDTVGDKELDYLGKRIVSVGSLSGDTFFVYRVKNANFLTGIEADLNEVRIIDHDATSGDGTIRTNSVLEMGVGYFSGKEIVAHDIAFNI